MFKLKRTYFIVLVFTLFVPCILSAQETGEDRVLFNVSSHKIESIHNNSNYISEITNKINSLQSDSFVKIDSIEFIGASSPDGNKEFNHNLAYKRLNSLLQHIKEQVNIPDSIVIKRNNHIDWEYLLSIAESLPSDSRDSVIKIIKETPEKTTQKNSTYSKLFYQQLFPSMRSAYVKIYSHSLRDTLYIIAPKYRLESVMSETSPIISDEYIRAIYKEQEFLHSIYIKTNVLGWALAVSNIACEVDLGKHWSFVLPIYYSGVNYFNSQIKFRIFAIQPGVRYWFNKYNDKGVFIEGHFGFAYYNFALNKKHRIQDHDPALGGGLSLGYKLPISRNNRLNLEFSAGVGAYKAHYDKFHNTPNTGEGQYIETVNKTFIGVDHVAVSLSYRFNLKRKDKQ